MRIHSIKTLQTQLILTKAQQNFQGPVKYLIFILNFVI